TEEYVRRLGNVMWIVDLNRQSLDRVVPDGKAQRIREMFGANGWHVINLKYGSRLKEAFARPHGERLRRRIDDMPNAEYQALLRLSGAEIRKQLVTLADGRTDSLLEAMLGAFGDGEVRDLLANLGGHDLTALLEAFAEAYAGRIATQEAFSRVLSTLSRHPIADFLVTASPDVATSTHLGGWINRRGVYSHQAMIDYFAAAKIARPIQWRESPRGQHLELGISENNLFLLLAALGLAGDQEGQRLLPLGTLYDPFVCRGLDAVIYAVYSGARFVLVATPSGVSLASEGGAHQSSITASIGIETPGLDYFEPTFAKEVEWILLDALRTLREGGPGLGVHLRLSTVSIDQGLFPDGRPGLREAVLGGGYRIVDRRREPEYQPEENVVNVFAAGAIVPEAVAASESLRARGILANVFAVTAPGRLYRSLAAARSATRTGCSPGD